MHTKSGYASVYILTVTRSGQPENLGSIPGGSKDFVVLYSVQTGLGAHLSSCPMVTVGSFLEGKPAWNMKLFTVLHLVPMLRICGAILSLPYIFSLVI
jgi:hypothetical protein